ncbi:hypothetical protein U9M48_018274 [Paspalum notatum var. saurae]|uniref:Reverse transcriptase domain-containing protein n=1 Tax=Paspalum notatum var. saurae TaxID=547442 RepID=A0AAQ3TBH2_PASNO
MRRPSARKVDFNWATLGLRRHDLSLLDAPFSEQEIKRAIDLLPGDKAPGPDGFTGLFLKTCWDIIKGDIMEAANAFHALRCGSLPLINIANIILIPKKEGADEVGDFRPISLIHSFVKLISKTLALRLQLHMNAIVSTCQSAFIKHRSIHDNFMAVRSGIRRFHRNKTPALFLKLDIAKAFDSISWEYLLALLEHLGFPTRWRGWIAAILSSSTSRVFLNGVPNPPLRHGRGLRQGDPLSPLLFVIAIDPLQRLLEVATEIGALTKLRGRPPSLRISMFADDAAIFITPTKGEVSMLARILDLFGEVTDLKTNFHKSTVVPIHCSGVMLSDVLSGLPAKRASFPLKYLGLPLSSTRLKRLDFQPLVDKISSKLNGWNGKNLSAAGRLTLVKVVLTSQVIYVLLALKPPKEVMKLIDSKRKQFLWAGTERLTGGKCKVSWTRAARPKKFGGLSILHLGKFSRALRLRWLWQDSKEPARKRVMGDLPCTAVDKVLFAAATSVTVGDGKSTLFWESTWLRGLRPRDIYPKIFSISRRKNRSNQEALSNNNWIKDLNFHHEELSAAHLQEYCQLWVERYITLPGSLHSLYIIGGRD